MTQINRLRLTQAQYARWRKERGLPGGTREAVRKAVAEGRITVDQDGLIDPEVADIQWAKNTRSRMSPQGASAPATATSDLVAQAGSANSPAPTPAPAAASTAPSPPPVDSGYTAARARREVAEAEQAEIELKKVRGELVSWADVQRGGFEVGRELRDTMESAVNSLAAELATITNAEQCAEILRRHNRAVCETLVRSWREKIGPVPAGGLAT